MKSNNGYSFFERLFDTNNIFINTLLFVLASSMLIGRFESIFSYNSNISGIEEVFVFFTQNLFVSKTFYPNPSEPPYIISQYTPLYFYVNFYVAKILNFDPEKVIDFFYLGRFISLLSNLVTFIYLCKIIKLYKSLSTFIVLSLFILYFGTLTNHSFAVRPDSLKSMFMVIGLYYLLKYDFTKLNKYFILSICSWMLAVFSKQDAIIEMGICLSLFIILFSDNKKTEILLISIVCSLLILIFCFVFYGQNLSTLFLKSNELISFKYWVFIIHNYKMLAIIIIIFLVKILINCKYLLQNNSKKFLMVLVIPMIIWNTFSLSLWGSAFVYLSTSMILLVLLLILFLNKIELIAAVLIVFTLIIRIDKYSNTLSKHNDSDEIVEYYKNQHTTRENIKKKLIENGLTEQNKVLTFDKLLSNYVFKYAIFPTYETEGVQYYYYGDIPMDDFKYIKKVTYNTKYLKENKEPLFIVTNHDSQKKLYYNDIDISNYTEISKIQNFTIYKRL